MDDKQDRLRRGRLHHLDRILDALERLNLSEASELPAEVRRDLEEAGVHVGGQSDFTSLIERVWELQEKYLNPPGPLADVPGAFRRGLSA